jgi:hypothetical protein
MTMSGMNAPGMIARNMPSRALWTGNLGKGATSVVPPGPRSGAALAAEGNPVMRFVR